MNQKDNNTEKTAGAGKQDSSAEVLENEKAETAAKQKDSSDDDGKKEDNKVKSDKKEQKMESNDQNTELEKFFTDAIQDIYYAEAAIEQSLAKIKSKATSEELQEAIEDHELVTRKQILRLEKVFKHLGEEPKKKKCDAIDGILKEVDEMVKSTKDGSMTRDVAIIIGAQKVEHYEIATYGGLLQIAITLGYDKIADLLETTLDEEEETDHLLTEIAEEHVNFEAKEE